MNNKEQIRKEDNRDDIRNSLTDDEKENLDLESELFYINWEKPLILAKKQIILMVKFPILT